MAKINLVEEVLKHSDQEIIEYLAVLMSNVRRTHNIALVEDKPAVLYSCGTAVETATDILVAMNKRNKQKSGQDEPVVL